MCPDGVPAPERRDGTVRVGSTDRELQEKHDRCGRGAEDETEDHRSPGSSPRGHDEARDPRRTNISGGRIRCIHGL